MITILNKKQKQEILKLINEQYGSDFNPLDEMFITSQNKIYLITKEALSLPLEKLKIRNLGLYIGQKIGNEIRLSIEGALLVGKTAKRRVLEISDVDLEKLKQDRFNLEGNFENGFYIVKYKSFIIGCVRHLNGEFINYIHKPRRNWN